MELTDRPRCSRCGAEPPADARFCGRCGHPVETPVAASPGPPAAAPMRPAHLQGERKIVTILFADVVGSTALAEHMDPEDWAGVMNRAYERMTPAIRRHDGTIARLMGDGLLAFFGAPVAHEDDPVRAVSAALDLLSEARAYAADVRRERGIEFAVRVGLHTGPAVLGDVGSRLRHEYTAMGDAVNLASRVEAAALPMTVRVTDETYRRVAGVFVCADLGTQQIRGKREPVHTFEVRARRPAAADRRPTSALGLPRVVDSPFVGRAAELARFGAALDGLVAGRGGIVAVLGEAGLGKSRLLTEGQRRSPDGALTWLEGRALAFGRTVSYWPILEILRGWTGIGEDDASAGAWRKLEDGVRGLFPDEAAEVLPYLGTLLELPVPDALADRVRHLDGEAMGRQVFRTVRRVVERLARHRPLVLAFEDVHWLDQSSAELLEHVLPLVERVPLLVVGTGRPDPDTPAARLHRLAAERFAERYTELRLAPLPPPESADLLAALLAADDPTTRLRDAILLRTEGNPFFAEEVVRELVDRRDLVWSAAARRWRAAGAAEVSIPDTVQGVITARLDRLSGATKDVLKTAAVIGRAFLDRVLRAVAAPRRDLDERLDALQRLEVILAHRRAPELEYVFKHALTQDAAYQMIVRSQRRELHRRVAAAIEGLFAERREEFAAVLAHHYAQAEDWPRAQEYLLKAGDQAGRMAADAEALALYEQAMAVCERVLGDRWQPLERAALERKIGQALFRRGAHDRAGGFLERALRTLGHPYPPTRRRVRWEIARQVVRQAGLLVAPWAARRADAAQQAIALERLRAIETLGAVHFHQDPERFLLDSLYVLNLAPRTGDAYYGVVAYSSAAVACLFFGLSPLASRYLRQALSLAEESRHPVMLAHAYMGHAIFEFRRGDWEVAIGHYRRCAELYRESGNLRFWGTNSCTAAALLALRGRIAESLECARDVLRVGLEAGDEHLTAQGERLLGGNLLVLGDLDAAIGHLRAARELFVRVADHNSAAGALAELGQCLVRTGQLEAALAATETAAEERSGRRPEWSRMTVSNGLAEAYLAAAEQAEPSTRPGWLQKADRACRRAVADSKVIRAGAPAAHRLRGTREWMRRRPKAARREWRLSLERAEQLGMPYERALTHAELARRTGSEEDRARALALFADLGIEAGRAEAATR